MPVALLAHADRRDAETEEARIKSRQLRQDGRKIQKIIVHDFAQLGVLYAGRAAPDREHGFDLGIDQAFAQTPLPDHPGGAEQDDFNRISRALVVSRIQAAAANWSKDTPVRAAETSQSRAATAASFACGMIFAGTGGPFNS